MNSCFRCWFERWEISWITNRNFGWEFIRSCGSDLFMSGRFRCLMFSLSWLNTW